MKHWWHPGPGDLRAYLDAAHPARRQNRILLHLEVCPRCRAALAEVEAGARLAARAAGLLQARLDSAPPPPLLSSHKEGFPMALPLWRRSLPYAAAATLLALMVSAVALPPVRAVAAQWLSVFRVEKIATVQISEQQFLSTARSAGERLTPQQARQFGAFTGPATLPEAVPVSLEEAARLAGGLHQPRLPGLAATPTKVWGLRPAEYQIQPDVDRINAWLSSQNLPARLSATLRGQSVRVVTPSLAVRFWGSPQQPQFALAEGTGVQVTGTAALDLQQLVDVIAAVAQVPADITQQLKAIPDLGSTLVLPVTPNAGEQVRVNGVRGVYYAHPQMPTHALIWTSDGKVYLAAGNLSRDELIRAVTW